MSDSGHGDRASRRLVIEADAASIPVGVDGESAWHRLGRPAFRTAREPRS